MTIYTTRFLKGFAGYTYGPIILIDPAYKDDLGLLAHEQTHVKQFWRTFGLHPILYYFSESYRLKSEVEAFRVQLGYSPYNVLRFAEFISTRYNINITVADAAELLTS
jgi:hypothetical protein